MVEDELPPPGSGTQVAIPDAVSFKRGEIMNYKPVGRSIVRDRQEFIRFIHAYQIREGRLPRRLLVSRYDPATGAIVAQETYTPEILMP